MATLAPGRVICHALALGQLADLAVLSGNYFSIPEEEIKGLESVLTMVGGRVVYATEGHTNLAPPQLPVSPDWSPVAHYGGYGQATQSSAEVSHSALCQHSPLGHAVGAKGHARVAGKSGLWSLGCDCFAF
jgi:hypothetical protein